MEDVIKWVVTPKCIECKWWHKRDRLCKVVKCKYKAKRIGR